MAQVLKAFLPKAVTNCETLALEWIGDKLSALPSKVQNDILDGELNRRFAAYWDDRPIPLSLKKMVWNRMLAHNCDEFSFFTMFSFLVGSKDVEDKKFLVTDALKKYPAEKIIKKFPKVCPQEKENRFLRCFLKEILRLWRWSLRLTLGKLRKKGLLRP